MQPIKHYIKKLPQDLVNKIAAGEVIARPASVLKELLENSIDAGSKNIAVIVEQAGIALIKIVDNGHGIAKDDLELALSQHATSKISSMDDLEKIASLGFRGEALASIGSVAKLTIASRASTAEQAWQINDADLVPIAQPTGTTITVQELFYNVPVRRKFLRSVNTEYQYLEQIFKAMVLSNFKIAFSIKHNHNKIKTYPICNNSNAMAKRVAKICGKNFVDNSVYLTAEEPDIAMHGWLGLQEAARAQTDLQYCYVNGRIVKDKLFNHAVREAYRNACFELPLHKFPAYVLYLTINAALVDVNVHPTKSEVRFVDSRGVHNFIASRIAQALNGANDLKPIRAVVTQKKVHAPDHALEIIHNIVDLQITPLCILEKKLLLAKEADKLIIIDLLAARQALNIAILKPQQDKIPSKPLLIPKTITLGGDYNLEHLGFVWTLISPNSVLLRQAPAVLQDLEINFADLINSLGETALAQQRLSLINQASRVPANFSLDDGKKLIAELGKYEIKRSSFSVVELQQLLR